MKRLNPWTAGLVAAGVVSLPSVMQAEEAMSQVLTAVSQTTLSGYIDTSAMWKIGTGNAALPGRAFDGTGKVDGFNLNVVSLTVEKPLDESQWSAGYKAQLLFGPDAVAYNTATGTGDFSLKDAYVMLRAPIGNGVDIKVGSFTTIIGYEVFESPNNPNWSRSFGWQLEPTQHTGVLASYTVCEGFSISGGVANTWFAGLNPKPWNAGRAESQKTYLGSFTITLPESMGFLKGASLYAGVVDGFAGNTRETTSLFAGASVPTPLEGVAVGLAYDYRFNGFNQVTPGSNWAYALAGYLSWQTTEKLRLNGRIDYTQGSDGTWYLGGGNYGTQNELISYTLTADYFLWANVITRGEVRWDHAMDGTKPFGGVSGPGGDKNALTAALNVIYRF